LRENQTRFSQEVLEISEEEAIKKLEDVTTAYEKILEVYMKKFKK